MVEIVNTDNEAEARVLIDNTLFVKDGVTPYQLFPMGAFYLGIK